MKKKIIVRLKGGLGNQLFCYAAARRLATVNDAELVLDDKTGFVRDKTYRRRYELSDFQITWRKATPSERLEPFERLRRGWVKFQERRKPFKQRLYVEQEGRRFDPRMLDIKVRKKIYLDGLWPSEDYFKDIVDSLRQDLRVTQQVQQKNIALLDQIKATNSIAIHMRFFGNPSVAQYRVLSDYYLDAVHRIERRISEPTYFLFTDNVAFAKYLISALNRSVVLTQDLPDNRAPIDDLWLISQCKNIIMSSSTFSWWAAWLSEGRTDRRNQNTIIVPKRSLFKNVQWAAEGSRLIPDRWDRIEVKNHE